MHEFIFSLVTWYLTTLDKFGLMGVVVLMAMESSIFPVPSELVVPPAAYLEVYRKAGNPAESVFLALLVILAGTIGSYLGASATYALARVAGRPFILKYGKYLLIPEHKLKIAEEWVAEYGAGGVFFARLLPVVRHLISIPAGIVGMRFRTFSLVTITGSAIWCTVLTIFGMLMSKYMGVMLRSGPNVESPEYKDAFFMLTWGTAALVVVSALLYVAIVRRHRATKDLAQSGTASES